MKTQILPPYIGAAYYPEMWQPSDVAWEIARMKEIGINCVRIGEFAWSRMEPEEGKFDFDWLKDVTDALYEAGIAVIMCTPSVTPPKWLTDKYPETLNMQSGGVRSQFGGRCHVCKSSPVMREKNRIITRKMGEIFGSHPGIIGWQLDNEIFHYGDGCFCPLCARRFTEYLAKKYGTVEALNAAWGTARWSLEYRSFDDVIPPRRDTWNHPSLRAEWLRFQDETLFSYIAEQADILHAYTKAPVGTDMMPPVELSIEKMNAALDVVQYNHYDRAEGLPLCAFAYDRLRPVKEHPFWNTETQAGWNGSEYAASGFRPAGNCYVNTWMPVAMGGEMNLYWLWRAHPNGHELGHGAVLSTAGRPYHVAEEISRAAKDFAACGEFLRGTKVRSRIAMHCSATAAQNFKVAPLVEGFDYQQRLMAAHAAFVHDNVDLIETSHSLDGYEVLLSPYLCTVDENGLKERVTAWVQAGGTWIVGPMSDIMDGNVTKYTQAPYGFLEELAGVFTKYQYPIETDRIRLRMADTLSECSGGFDAYELRGAESVAVYEGEILEGYTAIASRKVGKGRVILLGTMPTSKVLRSLVALPAIAEASDNVRLVARSGAAEGIIALETENRSGYVALDGEYRDLIGGGTLCGRIEVPAYGVLVLQKM